MSETREKLPEPVEPMDEARAIAQRVAKEIVDSPGSSAALIAARLGQVLASLASESVQKERADKEELLDALEENAKRQHEESRNFCGEDGKEPDLAWEEADAGWGVVLADLDLLVKHGRLTQDNHGNYSWPPPAANRGGGTT